MYKIVSNGEIIALCDKPRYVKKKVDSGAYIQCSESEAEAIAISGNLYNLPGNNKIENAPEVNILTVDSGEILFSGYVDKQSFLNEISSIEDALCEIDSGE